MPGKTVLKKEASAWAGLPLELLGLFSAGIVLLGAFDNGKAMAGGNLALGKQVFDRNCGVFLLGLTEFKCFPPLSCNALYFLAGICLEVFIYSVLNCSCLPYGRRKHCPAGSHSPKSCH